MQNVTLIGIDPGKHSFHVHCQDKSGKALLRKKLTRTFTATISAVTDNVIPELKEWQQRPRENHGLRQN